MKQYIPAHHDVIKEGLIVIGGAVLAALLVGSIPGLRDWIKRQWQDAPRGL